MTQTLDDLGFSLEYHTSVGGKHLIPHMRTAGGYLRRASPEEELLWKLLQEYEKKLGEDDGRKRKRG